MAFVFGVCVGFLVGVLVPASVKTKVLDLLKKVPVVGKLIK